MCCRFSRTAFPDCLPVLLSNFLFCGLSKFLAIDSGRDARRRFSVSLRFWLMGLINSAPFVKNDFLSPLAILLKGVLVIPAWLPVLTSHTSRHPRVIMGVLALAYLTNVLPVASGVEGSAARAG